MTKRVRKVKEIPLTQGQVALVDDEDYDALAKYKWSALKDGRTFYAVRSIRLPYGRRNLLCMHHAIIGKPPDGMEVDHKEHPGTDNRRSNLRFATRSQNVRNSKVSTSSKSGVKGVSWHDRLAKWRARIRLDGKSVSLGYFDSIEEAAYAYRIAAEDMFGEFARFE